jgi:hypothetical protein
MDVEVILEDSVQKVLCLECYCMQLKKEKGGSVESTVGCRCCTIQAAPVTDMVIFCCNQ